MSHTPQDLLAMAEPSQLVIDAIRNRPLPKVEGEVTIQKVRSARARHLQALRHLYPIPGPIPDIAKEVNITVPARDGYSIPVRIYTPVKKVGRPSPLILLYHEGGWCQGDLTDEEHDARQLTRDHNAVCVNIDYRLAPEHYWPIGLNDCYDVTVWAARNASPNHDLLPADPMSAGFIVGGVSAGGNYAAAMSQILRDEHFSPPITGQYLSVPVLLWDNVVPDKWAAELRSRKTSIKDPVLEPSSTESNATFLDVVRPDVKDSRFCPLLHESFRSLPPAYFQIAGLDPLRDEGLLYARLLAEENIPVKVDLYKHFGHAMWFNWPELEQSKKFFADTSRGVKWLLGQGSNL